MNDVRCGELRGQLRHDRLRWWRRRSLTARRRWRSGGRRRGDGHRGRGVSGAAVGRQPELGHGWLAQLEIHPVGDLAAKHWLPELIDAGSDELET
jgi:hypothetical protein